jgi:hypothetical protein
MKKLLFLFLIIPFFFECSTTQKSEADFSINFIVDKKWDRDGILYMFRSDGAFAGLAVRARNMGIDYNFAKRIQDAKDYSEIQNDLEDLVNRRYREIGNGLRKSAYDYSAAWESCIQEFSDVVTELTQHDWFYDSYTCVVSAFHIGMSNWYGNKITRHYGENPVKQRYITAYEILLSHTFHISRKYFNRIEAPDHIIWAISEITALLILEDERLINLWGDDFVQPTSIGYSQLKELEIRLRNVYTGNVDFKDYLQTAIQIAYEMNMDFSKPVEIETASFWLVTSIPEDLRQLTPTAIGSSVIIDNSLSVNLYEPFNNQDIGGWWTFSNKEWVGKGGYYIFFIPMKWAADGSFFTWLTNDTQIYVGKDSNPIKVEVNSSNINLSLDQFIKLY